MKAVFLLVLLASGMFCDVAELDNAIDNSINLDNKDFFQSGDLGDGPFDPKSMNLDASAFEAAAGKKQVDGPQTLDNNNLRSDEDFVRNSIPELKERDFDIDRFIGQFDRIDCSNNNGDPNDPMNLLCESELKKAAFAPLGQFNTDHNSFYNYLKDQIYMPLACDVRKRQNLSDMLVDTLTISDRNSIFNQRPYTANYDTFAGHILDTFEDIAGKTSDMEANKDAINELIVGVLKKFHIYWNFLRYKNQFGKLKEDTKTIMRTLLRSYMMKRDFLNYVSKTLIQGIIKAYYRFIRAHKMVDLLNKYGPELMVNQIITRYKAVGDKIKNSNFSQILIVKEMSYLISLLQVHHILSYKKGTGDNVIINNFNSGIVFRLQIEYDNYERYLADPQEQAHLKQIRDFTAVLLLKFKHMTFIMFTVHGIAQYANFPQMNYIKAPFAIKVYYELMDNMLLIPKTCTVSLQLKNCALHETHKNLRYISTKYKVKRSTYGWYFLQELSTMMKALYSKAHDFVWEDWTKFRDYFYPNLFAVMYTYKKLFMINDMDSVENLETLIGKAIDSKKSGAPIGTDFALLDSLDKDLYNEFLNIKADYNNYAPVQRDPTIMSYLQTRLDRFFKNFERDNNSRINESIKAIIDDAQGSIKDWLAKAPTDPLIIISAGGPSPQSSMDVMTSKSFQSNSINELSNPSNSQSSTSQASESSSQAAFGVSNSNGDLNAIAQQTVAAQSVAQTTSTSQTQPDVNTGRKLKIADDMLGKMDDFNKELQGRFIKSTSKFRKA